MNKQKFRSINIDVEPTIYVKDKKYTLDEFNQIVNYLASDIELNKNQQIVLEWLKDELNDSYFKAAVSNLFFWARYDDVEGFPNERSHKMVQAFEELDDKDFGQVLASFAEWGMKNDK
ncbi:hypothetical protein [Enterococcus gilvus]|uniref:hypothetical protein n=1 Tax=Enterococcus gilvus TaxID=160453 RepID=UPI0028D59F03|nr:hypothetical protein [Enterococcus gilvus]